GALPFGLDPVDSGQPLRLAAAGEHHAGAVHGELAGGLEAEPAVGAGDQEAPAALVIDLSGGPTVHVCSPASRSRKEITALLKLAASPGVDEQYRQLTDRLAPTVRRARPSCQTRPGAAEAGDVGKWSPK